MKIAWLLGLTAFGMIVWGLLDQPIGIRPEPEDQKYLVDEALSRQAKYLADVHRKAAAELRSGEFKNTKEFSDKMRQYWSGAEAQAWRPLDEEEQRQFGQPEQWDEDALADLMESRAERFDAHVQ